MRVVAVPAAYRAACEREVREGDEPRRVEERLLAESVAGRAGTRGAVEREHLRFQRRHRVAALRAGMPVGEQQPGLLALHRQHARRAARQLEGRLEGFGEALRGIGAQPQPVDHGLDAVLAPCVELRRRIELDHASVDARAHEAPRLQVAQHGVVRALAVLHQRREHHHRRAFAEPQRLVDHLAHGLRLERGAVLGAVRHAGARVEQAQVVVDLGDRAHRRTRIVRGRLLLDGDGRRQPVDVVDIGLVHHRQELPGIGRQRLDVAPLALGVEGVEGERGLARPGQPGDHDQAVAGDVEVEAAQVVGARPPDPDRVHGGRDGCVRDALCRKNSRLVYPGGPSGAKEAAGPPEGGGGIPVRFARI